MNCWQRKQVNVVRAMLEHWCTCVMRSKVEPMKEVAALVRRHLEGIVAWAQTRQAHLSPLRGYLRTWGDRRRVPILDLTEPSQLAAREGRVPWFSLDTHWNSAGHGMAAEALARWPVVRAAP